MSLDVSLVTKEKYKRPVASGIFVRANGKTTQISDEEWKKTHPHQEPIRFKPENDLTNEVYSDNITHNLTEMASHANLYLALWRPEEDGFKQAADLIEPLTEGLERLKAAPEKYKQYNPENGWGDYDGLLTFVENYLGACRQYPNAKIEVSR